MNMATLPDPLGECMLCGTSELVKLGNSFWTCSRCIAPAPKKVTKNSKVPEAQLTLSSMIKEHAEDAESKTAGAQQSPR